MFPINQSCLYRKKKIKEKRYFENVTVSSSSLICSDTNSVNSRGFLLRVSIVPGTVGLHLFLSFTYIPTYFWKAHRYIKFATKHPLFIIARFDDEALDLYTFRDYSNIIYEIYNINQEYANNSNIIQSYLLISLRNNFTTCQVNAKFKR